MLERDAQVIDVRETYEHEAGHIPGDRHLDLQHVALETDSIDQDRPVIFYCRAGIRSAMPTEAFRAAGWEAYNLEGGLLAWIAAEEGIEPSDGRVAPH
ncbi:rhodanese-like domain-containing protein [Brachybacterium squillarum]|nr:rhodanese-like domain-containing protein [Brachybacterium squillarum]MCW1804488.1 rhodanese-like domain-containing protein [Brachybacterium squillarum]